MSKNPDGGAPAHGIEIEVESAWLPEHSAPNEHRWAFAYTVTITNTGERTATLMSRHWAITDGFGQVEHVRGPGVVGYQPTLETGKSFQYTSGAILKTPTGMMSGEYILVREDGTEFEAEIPPFALVTPNELQ
jgi:ApaG protein